MFGSLSSPQAVLEALAEVAAEIGAPISLLQPLIDAALEDPSPVKLAAVLEAAWSTPGIVGDVACHPTTAGALACLRVDAGETWAGLPTTVRCLTRVTRFGRGLDVQYPDHSQALGALAIWKEHLVVADHLLHEAHLDLEMSPNCTWVGSAQDPLAGSMPSIDNRFADWARLVHREMAGAEVPPCLWMTSPRWIVPVSARAWPLTRVLSIPGGEALIAAARLVGSSFPVCIHEQRPIASLPTAPSPAEIGRSPFGLSLMGPPQRSVISCASFAERSLSDPASLGLLLALAAPGYASSADRLGHVLRSAAFVRLADDTSAVAACGGILYAKEIPGCACRSLYFPDGSVALNMAAVSFLLCELGLLPDYMHFAGSPAPLPSGQLHASGLPDILSRFAQHCQPVDPILSASSWWAWSTSGPCLPEGFVSVGPVTGPGELMPDGGYAPSIPAPPAA
jgi:hypothetical protein